MSHDPKQDPDQRQAEIDASMRAYTRKMNQTCRACGIQGVHACMVQHETRRAPGWKPAMTEARLPGDPAPTFKDVT